MFRNLIGTLLLVAGLAGCGFEPLMSQRAHPTVQGSFDSVQIATIPDRSGQILRNYLLDAITPRGTQGPNTYVLLVRLDEPQRDVAIRRDDTVSRASYTASATFQLVDRSQRRTVFGGGSYSETTYAISNSEFATLASQASARDRALQEVSADIRTQLAAFFAGKTPPRQ